MIFNMSSLLQAALCEVLIVDPYPVFCAGIVAHLVRQGNFSLCGTVVSGKQCFRRLNGFDPGLIILEPAIPDCDGLELIRQLSRSRPRSPILVFSLLDEREYAPRVFRAGARGFVHKTMAAVQLRNAACAVRAGRTYFRDPVDRNTCNNGNSVSPVALNDRELEIFRFLGKGYTTHHIAEIMGLSAYTVHTYRLKIKRKLRMDSAQLMRQATLWEDHLC